MPVPIPTGMPIMVIMTESPFLTLVDWEHKGKGILSLMRVSLGIILARVQVPFQLAGKYR